MSKGTIVYIGGFELPDKNAAAQRVVANAKVLKYLGYEVVFVGIDKSLEANTLFLDTEEEFEGFTYYSLKYPSTFREWINYLTSISYLTKLKNIHPICYIAYNYPAIPLMKLRRYCRKSQINLIADCTEWYEAKGGIVFRLIKGLDVYLRMKYVHSKLDGIIVISDYLYDFYKNKIDKPVVHYDLIKKSCSFH